MLSSPAPPRFSQRQALPPSGHRHANTVESSSTAHSLRPSGSNVGSPNSGKASKLGNDLSLRRGQISTEPYAPTASASPLGWNATASPPFRAGTLHQKERSSSPVVSRQVVPCHATAAPSCVGVVMQARERPSGEKSTARRRYCCWPNDVNSRRPPTS